MRPIDSLSHTRWGRKYHTVFIPKYRKKAIFGQIRRELVEVFRRLARQKESVIEEGRLMPDHVHMMISIPPKYAVSQVIGFLKGKSAIHIARRYAGRKRNFVGRHFWSRGTLPRQWVEISRGFGTTFRLQEAEDQRIDQLSLM